MSAQGRGCPPTTRPARVRTTAGIRRERIRGATIDVWYGDYPSKDNRRPAPSAYPFHELDNLYMTPHTSGWTTGMLDRRWTEIAANLDSLVRAEPLRNRLK